MDSEKQSIAPGLRPGEKEIGRLLSAPLDQVHKLLKRKMVQPADAWDIIQETMLFAYRNYDQHDQTKSLSAWVTGIALNKLRDHRKSQRVWGFLPRRRDKDREPLTEGNVERRWNIPDPKTEEETLLSLEDQDRSRDPLKRLLRKEAKQKLDDALARLNPKYADAVILHYILGYSYEEIAGMIGTSVGTVGPRVKRGIEGLRKLLRIEDVEELL